MFVFFFKTSPTRCNWRLSLPRWCTKYKEVFKKRIALKFALCAQDATMRPVISARCRSVGCFVFSGLWTWGAQWETTLGTWENCKMASQFLVPWVKKHQLSVTVPGSFQDHCISDQKPFLSFIEFETRIISWGRWRWNGALKIIRAWDT